MSRAERKARRERKIDKFKIELLGHMKEKFKETGDPELAVAAGDQLLNKMCRINPREQHIYEAVVDDIIKEYIQFQLTKLRE